MNRYNYGTGARKLEEVYERKTRKVSARKPKVDKVFVFSFILAAALAFTLLGRYAIITEKTAQIEALKMEYETVNSMVVSGEYEFEQSIDLKKVEETAIEKLGMQRPEKHQMVYINMNNEDYCEVKGGTSQGFLASLLSGVSRLWEYFR